MKTSRPEPGSEAERAASVRRAKRELGWMALIIAVVMILFIVERLALPARGVYPLSHNLLFFALINLNLILICLLLFLILRNLAKLLFERRQKILGYRLRTKLVAAFSAFALVPTAVMFYAAMSFVTRSIDNWFSIKIANSLSESLDVAKGYYSTYEKSSKFFAISIASSLQNSQPPSESAKTPNAVEPKVDYFDSETLRKWFAPRLSGWNADSIEVYAFGPDRLVYRSSDAVPRTDADETGKGLLAHAGAGQTGAEIATAGSGEVVRGVSPVEREGRVVGAVVVSYSIPNSVLKKMSSIRRTYEDYRQLILFKDPIMTSYFVIFALISIFIFFSATWFGFFLARGIAIPIQKMAEATELVAAGELDVRIEWEAKDEMGRLIESFNRMIEDLSSSREQIEKSALDLRLTNRELERRRHYMETVLGNISAGVISFTADGRVSTINKSACHILGLDSSVVGRPADEVFAGMWSQKRSEEIRRRLLENSERIIEREVEILIGEEQRTVLVRVTGLPAAEGEGLNAVMVLDDITEMIKGKRMAAWREIARRIAHEIKNPLTPIQLAAQRLRKRYGDRFNEKDDPAFFESTATIIRQVGEMKQMVQEFSNFARMADILPAPNQINDIISEIVVLYQEAHPNIEFTLDLSADVPLMLLDGSQIKRVFINLMDNATDAIQGAGRVRIRTGVNKERQAVFVHVADDGMGLPRGNRLRLYEPYFSTKKTGTGLGLAIVHQIMTDHGGRIELKDNQPRGALVILTFPLTLKVITV